MEATDASRLVCVVVVSYQEYSLTHSTAKRGRRLLIEAVVLTKAVLLPEAVVVRKKEFYNGRRGRSSARS